MIRPDDIRCKDCRLEYGEPKTEVLPAEKKCDICTARLTRLQLRDIASAKWNDREICCVRLSQKGLMNSVGFSTTTTDQWVWTINFPMNTLLTIREEEY